MTAPELPAVTTMLDVLRTDLGHLMKLVGDGGLTEFDDAGLVEVLRGFEQVRNQLPLVDHQLVGEAQRRDLAATVCQSSLPRMLASTLRISPGEAAQRVRAADALADRMSMTGQPLPPVRPHLAAAQHSGEISPEKADIVCRALAKVDRSGFDPDAVDQGEVLLTGFAAQFGPQDLRRLADQVVDAIDPDGTLPDDQLQQDRRFFHLRQAKDGSYTGEFRLTPAAGLKLQTLLGPLTRPKTTTRSSDTRNNSVGDAAGGHGGSGVEVDTRTVGQRRHDAVEDVCDRLLRADTAIPDSGGTPATVIVTIDIEDLVNRTGYAVAADGTLIPPDQTRHLTDQADIYWTVITRDGVPLRLARERRIATPGQTAALYARDRGCSFPSCATGPEWCERHHIVAWIDGGATDLDNLTLLCRYHHHNFLSRGWQCTINPDGLPEWRPPRWIDRDQHPLINNRIRAALAALQHRRQ